MILAFVFWSFRLHTDLGLTSRPRTRPTDVHILPADEIRSFYDIKDMQNRLSYFELVRADSITIPAINVSHSMRLALSTPENLYVTKSFTSDKVSNS